jgi:hypothetical protein
MGVLCIHSPKRHGPFSKLPIYFFPKLKSFKENGPQFNERRAATVAGWQLLVASLP